MTTKSEDTITVKIMFKNPMRIRKKQANVDEIVIELKTDRTSVIACKTSINIYLSFLI